MEFVYRYVCTVRLLVYLWDLSLDMSVWFTYWCIYRVCPYMCLYGLSVKCTYVVCLRGLSVGVYVVCLLVCLCGLSTGMFMFFACRYVCVVSLSLRQCTCGVCQCVYLCLLLYLHSFPELFTRCVYLVCLRCKSAMFV